MKMKYANSMRRERENEEEAERTRKKTKKINGTMVINQKY